MECTVVDLRPVVGGAAASRRSGRTCDWPASLSGWPYPQRQVQGEAAPLAGLAGEADLAAQQIGELAADGQPQPGAAELTAGGHVRLLEGFEDDGLLVGRDADARVGNRESDDGSAG